MNEHSIDSLKAQWMEAHGNDMSAAASAMLKHADTMDEGAVLLASVDSGKAAQFSEWKDMLLQGAAELRAGAEAARRAAA